MKRLKKTYAKFFLVACKRNSKRLFPHYYRLYGMKGKRYFLIDQAKMPKIWWLKLTPQFSKQISRLDQPYPEFDDDLNPI